MPSALLILAQPDQRSPGFPRLIVERNGKHSVSPNDHFPGHTDGVLGWLMAAYNEIEDELVRILAMHLRPFVGQAAVRD